MFARIDASTTLKIFGPTD